MKDEDISNNCKRVPVPEKFVYPGDGSTLFQEKNDKMVQPDAGNLESPFVEMTEHLRNLQEHIDQKGNSAEKFKKKALDSESDNQSPVFALKTPGRKSFPGFAPRSNLGQLHGDDHIDITSKTEGICKAKSFDGFRREYKSNTPDESSDDAGNLENSHFLESRSIIEEDTQIKFSKPSSMECDTKDSEDSSNIQDDSNHRLLKFVIPGNNLLDQTKSSSTKVVLIFLELVLLQLLLTELIVGCLKDI